MAIKTNPKIRPTMRPYFTRDFYEGVPKQVEVFGKLLYSLDGAIDPEDRPILEQAYAKLQACPVEQARSIAEYASALADYIEQIICGEHYRCGGRIRSMLDLRDKVIDVAKEAREADWVIRRVRRLVPDIIKKSRILEDWKEIKAEKC